MKNITYQNIILNIPDKYYIPNLTSRFKNNTYETEESIYVKSCFDSNDNVLELGSCLGYLSILLAKKCNNVISVEANPELLNALNKTKIDNNINNITFLNTIITKNTNLIDFKTYNLIVAGSYNRDDMNNPDNNDYKKYKNSEVVHKITPTDLLSIPNYETINSLMCDIEGAELIFLTEYEDFIKNNIKKICIELHGRLMNDKLFDKKCIDLLIKCGFKLISSRNGSYFFSK